MRPAVSQSERWIDETAGSSLFYTIVVRFGRLAKLAKLARLMRHSSLASLASFASLPPTKYALSTQNKNT